MYIENDYNRQALNLFGEIQKIFGFMKMSVC